jgi:hypothetical protein
MTQQKQECCDSDLSYLKDSKDKRDELYAKCIETLESMTSLSPEHIHVPIMRNKEDYEKYVVKNFIRCGAIPKKDLVIGKTYIGSCRNAGEAVWLGEQFEYDRYKFGFTFKEKINHFEDDNGYDLFVPLREK